MRETLLFDHAPAFDRSAVDRLSIADLVARGSDKWTRYPGCIGAHIAEMDYGTAPVGARAVTRQAS